MCELPVPHTRSCMIWSLSPPCSVSFLSPHHSHQETTSLPSAFSSKMSLTQGPYSFHFLKNYWFFTNQISPQSHKAKEVFCGHTPLSPVTSITFSCLVFVTPAPNSLICLLVYCVPYLPQEYKFPTGRFLVLFTVAPKQRQCVAHNRCSISIF